MDLCIILVFVAVSIGMGREAGYGMDRDCSDPGGRAKYIPVPAKWKWLLRLQQDTYASGNKILKASVGIYLSGYIAAIIELLIFFFAVFSGCEWEIAADWAYKICLSTGVLSGIIYIINRISQSSNSSKIAGERVPMAEMVCGELDT